MRQQHSQNWESEMDRKIYYWPHGTWCDAEDLDHMTHLSDDFAMVVVSYDMDDRDINRLVDDLVS